MASKPTLMASGGEDILFGNRDISNTLLGEGGQDVLRGIGAATATDGNLIDGGAGNDAIVLDSGVDLAAGGKDDDVFYVAMQSQFLAGGNLIDGGAGNDLINYSPSENTSVFGETNIEHAGVIFDGRDFGEGLELTQTMTGGSITVDSRANSVTWVLDDGTLAGTDAFTNVEALIGSVGNDTFIVGEAGDLQQLRGGDGGDLFQGLGSDIDSAGNRDFSYDGILLTGNAGNDTFELLGSHEIRGGGGVDTLDLSQSDGLWVIDVTTLDDAWGSTSGIMEHFASEEDLLEAGVFDDVYGFADIFVDAAQVQNEDDVPFFVDPSDAQSPFIRRYEGPLDSGQSVAGIEIIIGSDQRDLIVAGIDVTEVSGGGGDDLLGVRFDQPPGFDLASDYPAPLQVLYGGTGDDHLIGHFGAEILYGGDGDDVIDTVANVFETGPAGVAYGGAGADLFHALDYDPDGQFPGSQVIYGGEHTTQVVTSDGSVVLVEVQDAIDFGDGEVKLLNGNQDGVEIALDNSITPDFLARGLQVFEIENVFGTGFNDVIYGDDQDNVLLGRDGNDRLFGGDGDDFLIGGDGDDDLTGGDGDDIFMPGFSDTDEFNDTPDIYGGAGTDTLSFQFLRPDGRGSVTVDPDSLGSATVVLTDDINNVFGTIGSSEFTPDPDNPVRNLFTNPVVENNLFSIENVLGGRGDDSLTGNSGANVLVGDAGDDLIYGGGGDDEILAGSGDDVAFAGAGDDVVYAADGVQVFDGGEGGGDVLDYSANTEGLSFDLDAESVAATFILTTQVYVSEENASGTLLERAAVTKQGGSNDPSNTPGRLGLRGLARRPRDHRPDQSCGRHDLDCD